MAVFFFFLARVVVVWLVWYSTQYVCYLFVFCWFLVFFSGCHFRYVSDRHDKDQTADPRPGSGLGPAAATLQWHAACFYSHLQGGESACVVQWVRLVTCRAKRVSCVRFPFFTALSLSLSLLSLSLSLFLYCSLTSSPVGCSPCSAWRRQCCDKHPTAR